MPGTGDIWNSIEKITYNFKKSIHKYNRSCVLKLWHLSAEYQSILISQNVDQISVNRLANTWSICQLTFSWHFNSYVMINSQLQSTIASMNVMLTIVKLKWQLSFYIGKPLPLPTAINCASSVHVEQCENKTHWIFINWSNRNIL